MGWGWGCPCLRGRIEMRMGWGGGFCDETGGGGFTSMVRKEAGTLFTELRYITCRVFVSSTSRGGREKGREGEGERSGLRDMLFWVGKTWRVIWVPRLPCPAVFMAPLPSSRLLSFVSSRTLVVVIIDLLLRPSISVLFMLWYGMV